MAAGCEDGGRERDTVPPGARWGAGDVPGETGAAVWEVTCDGSVAANV